MTSMWADGIRVPDLLAARRALAGTPDAPLTSTARDAGHRYWSTPPRLPGDGSSDVLQVDLNERRLVNYLSFEVARFPHAVYAEYRDPDTGAWLPFLASESSVATAVSWRVYDSRPAVVGVLSGQGSQHPQHFGTDHWMPVAWQTKPVTTTAVRLRLVRQPSGRAPVDTRGQRVPYSLGVRLFQVGYRVSDRGHVPRYGDVVTMEQDFASTTDLLGSRVAFSLREHPARAVLTPADGDFWRSEPQPVSWAVVNFYVDTRTADGAAQVIDRWYLEPLTVGPTLNLYYSNDDPSGEFEASDTVLAYPYAQAFGVVPPYAQAIPPAVAPEYIAFSHTDPSFVSIDNAYLQWDPRGGSWWFGLEVQSIWYGSDGVPPDVPAQDPDHPILSFGGCTLRSVAGAVEFTNDAGEVATLPLPADHVQGSVWRLILAWSTTDGDYPAGLTMTYQLGEADAVSVTTAMSTPATRPGAVLLGSYSDTGHPGVPGFALRALVLKAVPVDADDAAAFLNDAARYVHRPDFAVDDPGYTRNSILRVDPARARTADNPIGAYGGPGDRYADLVWTPVARDYSLRQGYLHLPPTAAKYWKFEMTGLVAEQVQTLLPVRRTVRVFTTDTVRHFATMQQRSSNPRDGGPGVQASLDLAAVNQYSDAIGAIIAAPDPARHTPTEVLYARGIADADKIRRAGWVWGFQPWHIGSSAPRFISRTRHTYERVEVTSSLTVGYFAGLRSLRAYRVDHLADDDTAQYLDSFDDDKWVSSLVGVELRDGALVSLSGGGEATSKTLSSHRPIRAVQFAAQQSDAAQILPDDDFTGDFAANWSTYGDAEVTPAAGSVLVQRGWRARTYGDLESDPGWASYGSMEGHLYAELEGAQPDGVAGGGIQSMPIDPSASGRIYAVVKVTTAGALTQPVAVQILAADGDEVLASSELSLTVGQEVTGYVGYTVGSASTPLTYAEPEGQYYGDLDGTLYAAHESVVVQGPVYVRVAQLGATSDSFTVTRASLFDEPVQWFFSVDDGASWYEAMGVCCNPDGVLSLPEAGTKLRWRFRTFREGAAVTALAIRPWYAGLLAGIPHNHPGSVSGPNRSVVDQYPPIESEPLWQQWSLPVPRWWYDA